MSVERDLYTFIQALEMNSLKSGADLVRAEWEGTDALEICQKVLGNFWDDPKVTMHLDSLVKALTYVAKAPIMPANRLALAKQLLKNPKITPAQKFSLEHLFNCAERITKDQVKGVMEKMHRNRMFCQWVDDVIERNVGTTGAIATYMLENLGSPKINIFAYYLISDLGCINYNCDGLFKSPFYRQWVSETLSFYEDKPWLNDTHVKLMLRHSHDYHTRLTHQDEMFRRFLIKLKNEQHDHFIKLKDE